MNFTFHRSCHDAAARFVAILSAIVFISSGGSAASAVSIFLDADTPATGSNLATSPLVTPLGTITFAGEIRDRDTDDEFNAAGALGNVFDIENVTSRATMTFGFNVQSITFIYGGNIGVFDMVARDINGVTVASFHQVSTDFGQPAGPITLSAAAIRSIFWQDPSYSFAPIDNVTIVSVPEPSVLVLLATSSMWFGSRRRRPTSSHRV